MDDVANEGNIGATLGTAATCDPKFQCETTATMPADPRLPYQNWTRAVALDGDCHNNHQRQRDNEKDPGKDDVAYSSGPSACFAQ